MATDTVKIQNRHSVGRDEPIFKNTTLLLINEKLLPYAVLYLYFYILS